MSFQMNTFACFMDELIWADYLFVSFLCVCVFFFAYFQEAISILVLLFPKCELLCCFKDLLLKYNC